MSKVAMGLQNHLVVDVKRDYTPAFWLCGALVGFIGEPEVYWGNKEQAARGLGSLVQLKP